MEVYIIFVNFFEKPHPRLMQADMPVLIFMAFDINLAAWFSTEDHVKKLQVKRYLPMLINLNNFVSILFKQYS